MTPDQICAEQEVSVGLHLRFIPAIEEEFAPALVWISGSRAALHFLARVVQALSEDDPLPASFQLAPRSAGQFHLSPDAELGIYLECTDD